MAPLGRGVAEVIALCMMVAYAFLAGMITGRGMVWETAEVGFVMDWLGVALVILLVYLHVGPPGGGDDGRDK